MKLKLKMHYLYAALYFCFKVIILLNLLLHINYVVLLCNLSYYLLRYILHFFLKYFIFYFLAECSVPEIMFGSKPVKTVVSCWISGITNTPNYYPPSECGGKLVFNIISKKFVLYFVIMLVPEC